MAKNKTFFGDFKTFIARGNLVDMAVGVIFGGAFTTIVNSLSNNVLRPLINWILVLILGKDSLSEVYTFLQVAYKTDENGEEVLDLAESIYIDWGAFINAIINFFIIALVLFVIVRTINNLRGINVGIRETADRLIIDKKEIAELKEPGIDLKNRKAIQTYFEEKARLEKKAAEKAKAEEEEKSIAERAANPTSEELLKEIRDILKNK